VFRFILMNNDAPYQLFSYAFDQFAVSNA